MTFGAYACWRVSCSVRSADEAAAPCTCRGAGNRVEGGGEEKAGARRVARPAARARRLLGRGVFEGPRLPQENRRRVRAEGEVSGDDRAQAAQARHAAEPHLPRVRRVRVQPRGALAIRSGGDLAADEGQREDVRIEGEQEGRRTA